MFQPQAGAQARPQQYGYGYQPYYYTPSQTDMTSIMSQMMPMIMMIMMMGFMFMFMKPMMAGMGK
jgi:ATP-dependent Zn protease